MYVSTCSHDSSCQRPVTGDPGMAWMLVTHEPEFRVLRDYAEPGATRRVHSHDATYHVFVLATGQLCLSTSHRVRFCT